LSWLCLEANDIDDEGAIALAASPHLERLTQLSLRYNPIDDRGREALQRRFGQRLER